MPNEDVHFLVTGQRTSNCRDDFILHVQAGVAYIRRLATVLSRWPETLLQLPVTKPFTPLDEQLQSKKPNQTTATQQDTKSYPYLSQNVQYNTIMNKDKKSTKYKYPTSPQFKRDTCYMKCKVYEEANIRLLQVFRIISENVWYFLELQFSVWLCLCHKCGMVIRVENIYLRPLSTSNITILERVQIYIEAVLSANIFFQTMHEKS